MRHEWITIAIIIPSATKQIVLQSVDIAATRRGMLHITVNQVVIYFGPRFEIKHNNTLASKKKYFCNFVEFNQFPRQDRRIFATA